MLLSTLTDALIVLGVSLGALAVEEGVVAALETAAAVTGDESIQFTVTLISIAFAYQNKYSIMIRNKPRIHHSYNVDGKTYPRKLLLQARIPSAHMWSKCVSPASPQFLNQAPPRAQQLS